MTSSVALGSNVGVAWVQLRFSARGAAAQIRSQLAGETAGLGATMGSNLGNAAKKSFSKRLAGFGSVLQAEGKKLSTHLTLPIVALGAESIHMASTFQASMTKVRTQAGASQKEVDRMSKAVLAMGRHSQQGPEKLSEALYHLESLGLRGSKALRALKSSEDLANVSGADMEQTTSAIGAAWRSGIKGAGSFAKTAATLNAIVGAGNMRMSDLLGALGTGILPAARTFGVSLKSVGGALAVMTDEGVPAVDAATRLRMSMSLLGAPSQAADKVLKSIGLNGTDLAKALRGPQGLLGAIVLLHDHMKGLSKVAQAQLLSHAFGGGRSSGAIMTLMNQIDVTRKKVDQVSGGISKFGAGVTKQATTSAAKFAEFKSAVQDLGISIGQMLLPFVTRLAGHLTNLVDGFGHLSKGTQRWILIAAGIAAVAGPILMIVGSVAKGVSVVINIAKATKIFSAQMWILNAAMDANPVGIVLLAVEALAVAFFVAYKRSKTFRDVVASVGHWLIQVFKDLLQWGKDAMNGIIKAIRFMWKVISAVFSGIIHAAADAFGWVPGLGGKLHHAADEFDKFRNRVNNALGGINNKHVDVGIQFATMQGMGKGVMIHSAQGGPIYGPGTETSDSIPAALSHNEFVMKAKAHRKYGTSAMRAVNEGRATIGYRDGGPVDGVTVQPHFPSIDKMMASAAKIIARMAKSFAKHFGGEGIVADAMRWIGRIPYVWGGTRVPGGADCSGFVQTIYSRHGIHAPRTSEAQGAWVQRTHIPVPGGLAFYNSPAGGPPPGHVAIIGNNGMVISQGGGMGPQYESLHSMPLMFMGIPPGGLGFSGLGFGANGPIRGGVRGIIQAMAAARGWTGRQWNALDAVEMREARYNLKARNPSGAFGVAEFIQGPGEYYRYGGNPYTAQGQGTAFLNYVRDRYGRPTNALAHEQRYGWYDDGGVARGLGFLPKRTPLPERVLSPQQTSAFERLVDALDGRSGGSAAPARQRVEFDPRTMEMYIRNVSRQEAVSEIRFAGR